MSAYPCQDSSIAHGVTAGRSCVEVGWHCLCCHQFACSYTVRKNAPVMEPGATSALGPAGVKKQRGILQHLVPVMSCLHQCAHPWKLPLHALQTLCLLQRSLALFLCPFSPTAQEEQIKSISHKEGRMWFLNDPSWELPSLLTSGGQKYELCRTCLPRRTGVKA